MTTFAEKYKNLTASEILRDLEEKYQDKEDALENIARAKKNIEYIEEQENYKGQTPWQCAVALAGDLEFWG